MCLVTLSSISAQRTHAAAHAGRFRRQQLPAVWTGRSTTCACACWLTLASIALCHLLCSVPKAQQAIHMLLRACLLFTVISLVAAYSVRPRSEISCNECLLIAKTLEAQLLKLEQVQDPEDGSLVGKITHRRRLSHPRSEPQIFNALDTICSTVPAGGLQQGCVKLISEHRETLENDIYAEGIEHVRRLLCSDFSKTCPMHALYDTGEL